MSNWTSITTDHLKAAGYGTLVDRARTTATGGLDPVTEAIAEATARVRGACSTGNSLDADATRVPNSLRGLTVRMALYALAERIGLPLRPDQRDTRKEDASYLLRITDHKLRFEQPDTAAGSAEMQSASGLEALSRTPREQYDRGGLDGLR